jgi:hypothetical protein
MTGPSKAVTHFTPEFNADGEAAGGVLLGVPLGSTAIKANSAGKRSVPPDSSAR